MSGDISAFNSVAANYQKSLQEWDAMSPLQQRENQGLYGSLKGTYAWLTQRDAFIGNEEAKLSASIGAFNTEVTDFNAGERGSFNQERGFGRFMGLSNFNIPASPKNAPPGYANQQAAVSIGAVNIEEMQSGALPSMGAPIGGGGPAVVPIGRGAPINPSPSAVAMSQGFDNAITGASMAGFNDIAAGFSDAFTAFSAYAYAATHGGKLLDPKQIDAVALWGNPDSSGGGATSPGALFNTLPAGASLKPPSPGQDTNYWSVDAPNGQTWYFSSQAQANAAVQGLSYYSAKNPFTGKTYYFSSKAAAANAAKGWNGTLTVGQAAQRFGQTAAYIVPGGAILHGLGDTQEGVAARAFDVGVGLLWFVPGLGELGEGFNVGTRLGIGAGVGGAISGVGTALHGGTLIQDIESAALGAGLGATGAYILPKVVGAFRGGPPEPAPPVTEIGVTPEGETVVGDIFNFPGNEIHGGPAGVEGQVGPGDVISTERWGIMDNGPIRGFNRVTLPSSGFDPADIEGSLPTEPGFLESEAHIVDDPLRGETYMEGPAPGQSTSALKGRPFPSYRGEPKIDFGGEGVTPKPVKTGFGYDLGNGAHTTFDVSYYQNLGNPSFDESLSGPVTPPDETPPPRPPAPEISGPEVNGVPIGGENPEGLLKYYENFGKSDAAKTDYFGNQQGAPWEEARFRAYDRFYANQRTSANPEYLFLTTPPSYQGPVAQTKTTPIEGFNTFSSVAPRFITQPVQEQQQGPGNISSGVTLLKQQPPQTMLQDETFNQIQSPDSRFNFITVPSSTWLQTPINVQQQQPTEEEIPFLFTGESGVFDVGPQNTKPASGWPFPGVLIPLSGRRPGRKGGSGFDYNLKVHDLGDLLSLGSGKSKRKNPFAL
ncbi:MAG: hypothetical protein JRN50_03890 [Nitrososphaerota archaeon]|nr:hypothetical protein [Nitrososphaerota archaeon]